MINPTDAYVSTQQPQPQVTNVNVFNHPEMGGQGGVATDKKRKQAKHHNRFVFVYCIYNICACAFGGVGGRTHPPCKSAPYLTQYTSQQSVDIFRMLEAMEVDGTGAVAPVEEPAEQAEHPKLRCVFFVCLALTPAFFCVCRNL